MSKEQLRVLFLPVSGAGGAGEYFRCRAIAAAIARHRPDAQIEFVLNRASRYASECPYPVHMLNDSPTRAVAAVNEVLNQVRPTIAVFDSSGRVAQYKAARALGAKVIYISSRPRARWKGFRVRRMRLMDQHWIIQPPFVRGSLTLWERLKLRAIQQPQPVFVPTMFEPFTSAVLDATLVRFALSSNDYIVVCPGGAGHFAGVAHALSEFEAAARALADQAGCKVLYVGEELDSKNSQLVSVRSLPNSELMALVNGARLAVVNGGSLLLQVIAQSTPSVAAPIALDQQARVEACAKAGATQSADLTSDSLASTALKLLRDDLERAEMRRRIQSLGMENGVAVAVAAIDRLLATR